MLQIADHGRTRLLTLERPEALNAFNEELCDLATDALIAAADDPRVAVVVLTGTGRAFSSGTDVVEMAAHAAGEDVPRGRHGFLGFIDQLAAFPKPFVCAVNGLALGIGATLLGYADLVFMSTDARVRCPFTALGVAPEAGSSYTFPALMGRQHASWVLLSSEWISAEECQRIGLAWKICAPDDLLDEAMAHATVLATKPIASLVESKRTIIAALAEPVAEARARENAAFARLMGTPANVEALAALAERRQPDFVAVDERQASDGGP
jgi:enoyl-CoA hydratase/carnithine racemase